MLTPSDALHLSSQENSVALFAPGVSFAAGVVAVMIAYQVLEIQWVGSEMSWSVDPERKKRPPQLNR